MSAVLNHGYNAECARLLELLGRREAYIDFNQNADESRWVVWDEQTKDYEAGKVVYGESRKTRHFPELMQALQWILE